MLEKYFPRRNPEMKPGAHRMLRLFQTREFRQALELPCVLVVGTNGKGTVCRFIERGLIDRGVSCGTYSSPHFINPLERIRIDGRVVDPVLVQECQETVEWLSTKFLPDASFFEITTAIALLCFIKTPIDFAVIEAGLGGNLDSTNALRPLLTVLTSVGIDHADRLGSSLAEIARDKAFASRRNRPLICGWMADEAKRGVVEAVKVTGAHCEFALEADCDPEVNFRTAFRALYRLSELPETRDYWCQKPQWEEILNRLQTVHLPGRFDLRQDGDGRQIIFDNAHNPAAASFLANKLKEMSQADARPTRLIFGSLRTKDFLHSFRILQPFVSVTSICLFDHEDSLHLEDALELVPAAQVFFSCDEAAAALRDAPPSTRSLVTGSFAFVGMMMKALEIEPEENATVHES